MSNGEIQSESQVSLVGLAISLILVLGGLIFGGELGYMMIVVAGVLGVLICMTMVAKIVGVKRAVFVAVAIMLAIIFVQLSLEQSARTGVLGPPPDVPSPTQSYP